MYQEESANLERRENSPNHVAIIMDGNGRWAQLMGYKRTYGHVQGAKTVKKIVRFASDELQLPYLTLFAFSTENWRRPLQEVNGLMDLFYEYLYREIDELVENNVKLEFIGQTERLPGRVQEAIADAKHKSSSNTGMQMTVAMAYGGRQEIIEATNRIIDDIDAGNLEVDDIGDIDEETFRTYLYEPNLPDPDIIIRSGGEERLSNFFIWQAADAFFWATETLWPDFSKTDLLDAISAYHDAMAN